MAWRWSLPELQQKGDCLTDISILLYVKAAKVNPDITYCCTVECIPDTLRCISMLDNAIHRVQY